MTTFANLFVAVNLQRLIFIPFMVLQTLTVRAQAVDDLFDQIQTLQSQTNIMVIGLEKVQNEAKIKTHGSPEQQMQQLLAPFNHVISRNVKGQIDRIVILNKKQKTEGNRIILPTSNQGNHLLVSVAISGNGSIWQTLDMLIDTGADMVVLPESMIAQLGLGNSAFTQRNIQTANGMVEAKLGLLQALKIAGETVDNVEAAFIPDSLLGDNSLLGMSVLGRYRMTIDDQSQTITLFKKE
jgi:aspartyl protease family protein